MMTEYKTTLAKIRGLGSARGGTHHWWMQRLTALANIPLGIFVLVSFVGNMGQSYENWLIWLSQPLVAVLMVLFVLNLAYHLRHGLQVAIEDYIHTPGLKIFAQVKITFITLFLTVLSIFSILKIAFGG